MIIQGNLCYDKNMYIFLKEQDWFKGNRKRDFFWGGDKKQFTESQVCVLKAMQLGCTKLGCRGVLTRLDR